MKNKQKIIIFGIIVILLIGSLFMLHQSTKKIAYLEYVSTSQNCNQTLEMTQNACEIEQEFKLPYELFCGIGFSVGTYGRVNNSQYEMVVMDKTLNQKIASQTFSVTHAQDGQIFKVMFDSPVCVDSTHLFSVIIKAKTTVNTENGIAFYVDKDLNSEEKLYYNNAPSEGNLCMNLYGGNSSIFFTIFTLGLEVYVMALAFYIIYLYSHQRAIKSNAIVQAGLLGIVVFLLLVAFGKIETFSDEADNIIGGMLLQKGSMLYVDYYTGHTPFAYWLCTLFAGFGAISVEQFRYLYDVLIALIYAGLFLRHHKYFGKVKMVLIPILQITFGVLLAPETIMILSDNIQAICMIVLFLEFLRYLNDEKLDWGRAIVVSLSIFCSFGSAFVSAYAIFAICVGVFIKEVIYWQKNKFSIANIIKRYWKLVIACAVPFVFALGHLILTHSLGEAYEQAFKFNTEVYSGYLEGGFGSNLFQPFFIGISNFLQIIPNAFLSIAGSTDIILSITKIILTLLFIFELLKLIIQKEYLKAVVMIVLISFSFTRTNEPFHEIAAWSLILVAILMLSKTSEWQKNVYKFSWILAILLIFSNYINTYTQNIFQKQEPISELEKQIIDVTSDGEEIFYDIYSCPSVYVIYKNRMPMNRLTFVLPWYMEWYELDVIEDLSNQLPKTVVYDEDLKAWEISGYDAYLKKYLHENYEQTPKSKKIWTLRE